MSNSNDKELLKPTRKPAKVFASVRDVANKKGLLAHEVDEGAPCLVCGDKCPGFSLHFWRKVCKNCLCPREEHDVKEDNKEGLQVGKLLFAPTASLAKGGSIEVAPSPKLRRPLSKEPIQGSPATIKKISVYSWAIKGATPEAVERFVESLPEAKRPIKDTAGERYYRKQLVRQLPAHDMDITFCNEEDLSVEDRKQMELFYKIRREKVVGRGELKLREASNLSTPWVCASCNIPMKTGDVAVFAEQAKGMCWHPTCFTCSECNELLAQLIYFWDEKELKLYCGRHHAEIMKPRCAACDEIIVCPEYTCAEDQNWHLNHFCCVRCDQGLAGKEYRPQDGKPHCISCYDLMFSTVCEACGMTISLEQSRLVHNNMTWHGDSKCFKCNRCGKSLVEKPFLPKDRKIYCSKKCAREDNHSDK